MNDALKSTFNYKLNITAHTNMHIYFIKHLLTNFGILMVIDLQIWKIIPKSHKHEATLQCNYNPEFVECKQIDMKWIWIFFELL